LESLYFEMVEIFDSRIEELDQKKGNHKIYALYTIQSSIQRMIEYRYIWADLYYLLKFCDRIKRHFESVNKDRLRGNQYVFSDFIKRKLLKQPTFSTKYQLLAERMIDYSNTWLYASRL